MENLATPKNDTTELQNKIKKLEKCVHCLYSEYSNTYGMPEKEAVHFRNRRMKVILEEYLVDEAEEENEGDN